MNANDRAASALLVLRGDLDAGAPGDHRADAIGALLELMAAGVEADWLRVALAELWRGRMSRTELRACVDNCLRRVSVSLVTEAAPRRSTLLPPPSGRGDEERVERTAARSSLPSIPADVTPIVVVPALSTVPASASWAAEVA